MKRCASAMATTITNSTTVLRSLATTTGPHNHNQSLTYTCTGSPTTNTQQQPEIPIPITTNQSSVVVPSTQSVTTVSETPTPQQDSNNNNRLGGLGTVCEPQHTQNSSQKNAPRNQKEKSAEKKKEGKEESRRLRLLYVAVALSEIDHVAFHRLKFHQLCRVTKADAPNPYPIDMREVRARLGEELLLKQEQERQRRDVPVISEETCVFGDVDDRTASSEGKRINIENKQNHRDHDRENSVDGDQHQEVENEVAESGGSVFVMPPVDMIGGELLTRAMQATNGMKPVAKKCTSEANKPIAGTPISPDHCDDNFNSEKEGVLSANSSHQKKGEEIYVEDLLDKDNGENDGFEDLVVRPTENSEEDYVDFQMLAFSKEGTFMTRWIDDEERIKYQIASPLTIPDIASSVPFEEPIIVPTDSFHNTMSSASCNGRGGPMMEGYAATATVEVKGGGGGTERDEREGDDSSIMVMPAASSTATFHYENTTTCSSGGGGEEKKSLIDKKDDNDDDEENELFEKEVRRCESSSRSPSEGSSTAVVAVGVGSPEHIRPDNTIIEGRRDEANKRTFCLVRVSEVCAFDVERMRHFLEQNMKKGEDEVVDNGDELNVKEGGDGEGKSTNPKKEAPPENQLIFGAHGYGFALGVNVRVVRGEDDTGAALATVDHCAEEEGYYVSISLVDLVKVLEGMRFRSICFDCCLMGTAQTASSMYKISSHVVACEGYMWEEDNDVEKHVLNSYSARYLCFGVDGGEETFGGHDVVTEPFASLCGPNMNTHDTTTTTKKRISADGGERDVDGGSHSSSARLSPMPTHGSFTLDEQHDHPAVDHNMNECEYLNQNEDEQTSPLSDHILGDSTKRGSPCSCSSAQQQGTAVATSINTKAVHITHHDRLSRPPPPQPLLGGTNGTVSSAEQPQQQQTLAAAALMSSSPPSSSPIGTCVASLLKSPPANCHSSQPHSQYGSRCASVAVSVSASLHTQTAEEAQPTTALTRALVEDNLNSDVVPELVAVARHFSSHSSRGDISVLNTEAGTLLYHHILLSKAKLVPFLHRPASLTTARPLARDIIGPRVQQVSPLDSRDPDVGSFLYDVKTIIDAVERHVVGPLLPTTKSFSFTANGTAVVQGAGGGVGAASPTAANSWASNTTANSSCQHQSPQSLLGVGDAASGLLVPISAACGVGVGAGHPSAVTRTISNTGVEPERSPTPQGIVPNNHSPPPSSFANVNGGNQQQPPQQQVWSQSRSPLTSMIGSSSAALSQEWVDKANELLSATVLFNIPPAEKNFKYYTCSALKGLSVKI